MLIDNILKNSVIEAFAELYEQKVDIESIQIQKTRQDFKGDFTIVVFPLLRYSKKSPIETASELGEYLNNSLSEVSSFNVIKGFLNISLSDSFWINYITSVYQEKSYENIENSVSKTYMIEYSSPNTNKPLHLGHIRNNLIGYSVANILKANGHKVIKVNLVNDRGIHICKSMLAWQKFGVGETPETSNKKGDHLVGEYYVKFDTEYKKQIAELEKNGSAKEEANAKAPIMIETQEMLRKWESNDKEVRKLWQKMNNWVYAGFDETYKNLGVDFDKIYYESETYILGRKKVLEGLNNNVFFKKKDGSVWVDLTNEGLDHKLLIRSDGTTVYMTQDIGTAIKRVEDYNFDEMIYVVGNEQDYHFKVLGLILDKLGFSWARNLKHLSYGMVELPSGKMKSREGTVVDADDLMDEMIDNAKEMSIELGKLDGYTDNEKQNIYRIIGLGALKYFILKVDPKKNMTFDPKESIELNGNTGPFIQYTYARINSLFRKAKEQNISFIPKVDTNINLSEKEIELIKLIYRFPEIVKEAGDTLSPALLANYTYELVKNYNQFYHDFIILKESDNSIRNLRLLLSEIIGNIIKNSMELLGIEVPERM